MTPTFVLTLGDCVAFVAVALIVFLFLGTHAFERIDQWRELRRQKRQAKKARKP